MKPTIIAKILLACLALVCSARSLTAQGWYTVRGKLFYYDGRTLGTRPVGQYNGAANLTYEIYDADSGSDDDLLESGIVDWDGSFSSTFYFSQGSENWADLYVKFRYTNSKWRVHTSSDATYAVVSATRTDSDYGTVDFGSMYVSRSSTHEQAMWVFQSINEGWNYVEGTNDWDVGDQIDVQWPGQSSCPTSCASLDQIHITQSRAGNTLNVIHEYGHVVNFRAWGEVGPSVGYCRTESSNCGHSWNSNEWPFPSFTEGWAEFVAYATLGGVGNDTLTDLENRNYNTMDRGNEGNVCAVLGDILDDDYDLHSQGSYTGYDVVSWNFYGLVYTLWHMSNGEVDDAPAIDDYIDEIREFSSSVSYTSWSRLMQNSWVDY